MFTAKFGKIAVLGVVVVLIVAGLLVFGGEQKSAKDNRERSNSIAFVLGSDGKMRYIKAEGCPNEAYESTDNNNISYYMCRSYTTDGEFVYYN